MLHSLSASSGCHQEEDSPKVVSGAFDVFNNFHLTQAKEAKYETITEI